MRLVEIEKLEDCMDGSLAYRYCFDGEVNEELMRKMAAGCKLHYFPEFSRPFFKIFTPATVQIKGILGDRDFEVVYPLTGKVVEKRAFEAHLAKLLGGPK